MSFKPGDKVRVLNAHPLDIFNPPSSAVVIKQLENQTHYYRVKLSDRPKVILSVHENDMMLDSGEVNDMFLPMLCTILAGTFVVCLLYWTMP